VTLALRELAQAGFVSRAGRRYRLNVSAEDVSAGA
jgi:hypothetical protein